MTAARIPLYQGRTEVIDYSIDWKELKGNATVVRKMELLSAIIPTIYGNFFYGPSRVAWHNMTLKMSLLKCNMWSNDCSTSFSLITLNVTEAMIVTATRKLYIKSYLWYEHSFWNYQVHIRAKSVPNPIFFFLICR
jgi:hypothetical protein